ncbi:MAG: hypothetical protein QOH28_3350 [Actinomycetota bacterium]|jgi:hypothetical protein|nr:hypothetical protein [Actinomycetota bacterium]
MARVRVRIDDLERGDLPALSVKTGRACANPVAIVLRPEQRLVWPTGRKIAVILPLEAARARARVRLTRVTWVLLVAGAAALVAAVTGAGPAVLLLAAGALVAYGALVLIGELRWIGSRLSEVDGEVELTRVHRAFARAVDEQYGR